MFNKSIIDFYYDNRFCKNKSLIFTLINSLLNIGNITFNLYDIFDKEIIIKDFIKKIDSDLFQLDLYNKFNYNKNKRFNKSDIQFVLKNAIQFKYCDKIIFDINKSLKRYGSNSKNIRETLEYILSRNK